MQSTKFAAALGARVDGILDVALTEQRVVGAVGQAERETQRPMRTDTLFRLSSMTKPYVSVAALALIARGQLSLDDRIDKWLPEFQPRLATGAAAPITVHQLLTHTAGLGYGFHQPSDGPYHHAHVSDGLDQPGLPLAENLRRLGSVPLLRQPGVAKSSSLRRSRCTTPRSASSIASVSPRRMSTVRRRRA